MSLDNLYQPNGVPPDETPWREDEIEFITGDWKIFRASAPGLYTYEIGGVSAQTVVDAVQLVEWHMAEVIRYEAHTPWVPDIVFNSNFDILRDLTDQSAKADKKSYIIFSDGKYYRVNSFYLVLKGLATATEDFKSKVDKISLRSSKSGGDTWDEDKIVLVPKEGYTVEKAPSRGRYKVYKGYTCFTWDASRILEEGLAVTEYEKKLNSKSSCKSVSFSEIKKDTYNFWMDENADSVCSLHDIAIRWHDLTYSVSSPELCKIFNYNRKILDSYSNSSETSSRLNEIYGEYKTHAANVEEGCGNLRTVLNKCVYYKNLQFIYPSQEREFTELKNVFDRRMDFVLGEMKAVKQGVSTLITKAGGVLESGGEEPFPLDKICFPDEIENTAEMREAKKNVALIEDYRSGNISGLKNDVENSIAEWENGIFKEPGKLQAEFDVIASKVRSMCARRVELDSFVFQLGAAAKRKKRYLINRSWKSDRIRFTTEVSVIRAENIGYYYVLLNKSKKIKVSVIELIYMNLAVRK